MFIDYQNQNRFQVSPIEDPVTYSGTNYVDWFVDCGIVLRHRAHWVYSDASTRIKEVLSGTGSCTVVFEVSGSIYFEFTVMQSDQPGTTYWVNDTTGGEYGRAFLTIGHIHEDMFAGPGNNVTVQSRIRKEKIHTLFKKEIRSLSIATEYNTLYQDTSCFGATSFNNQYAVIAASLNGNFLFDSGRHVNVLAVDATNTLSIAVTDAASILGDIPCQSPRTLPAGYSTANEISCGDLLYTINGIGPLNGSNIFLLEGSDGVTVSTVNGSLNALVINFASTTLFGIPGSYNCGVINPYNSQSYNCVY